MSKSEIYQLSQFQFDNLSEAANGRSACFVVISSNETDPPDRKETFDTQSKEIEELIQQGLLKDVSDKFQEPIQLAKLNNNRACRIVMITETALKLFGQIKNKRVN